MKSKTAEKDLQLFLFQEGDILERPSNQQLQVLLYISALNRVLRQDPIFDGLISKHSGLNFHNDRQHREALSWDILGDEEKLRIENRYAYEALRHLVNSVLTTDLPFNEDVYLTSCEVDFGTRYFGGLEAKVASFGKLYCVVLLASFLKQFFGCAFDYAVLMVITGNLPSTNPPKEKTFEAVAFILVQYGLPNDAFGLEEKLASLPWRQVRLELLEFLAPAVRKECKRLGKGDPGERPTLDLYPHFCFSEAECRHTLTNAALSISRMIVDTGPPPNSNAGSVTWTKSLELRAMAIELVKHTYYADSEPRIWQSVHRTREGKFRVRCSVRLPLGIQSSISLPLRITRAPGSQSLSLEIVKPENIAHKLKFALCFKVDDLKITWNVEKAFS